MSDAGGDRLTPLSAGGPPVAADRFVDELRLRDRSPAGRPYVVAAMITSADGRATVGGKSTGLGNPADRSLLRSLRAAADAVLVGTATIRAERYANLLDAEPRARRVAEGRPPVPPVATISRTGDVPWEVGLFDEPDAHVVVFSEADVDPPTTAARVTVERGTDPAAVLAALHDGHGARAVLCEGGPTLLRSLAQADLIDAMLLTVAPTLVAGDGPAPLEGSVLDPPVRWSLRGVHRAGDHAMLHYERR